MKLKHHKLKLKTVHITLQHTFQMTPYAVHRMSVNCETKYTMRLVYTSLYYYERHAYIYIFDLCTWPWFLRINSTAVPDRGKLMTKSNFVLNVMEMMPSSCGISFGWGMQESACLFVIHSFCHSFCLSSECKPNSH